MTEPDLRFALDGLASWAEGVGVHEARAALNVAIGHLDGTDAVQADDGQGLATLLRGADVCALCLTPEPEPEPAAPPAPDGAPPASEGLPPAPEGAPPASDVAPPASDVAPPAPEKGEPSAEGAGKGAAS